MKTTDHFKRTIQMYLEQRAAEDGYKVRGRVYTLSEQDRLIFNNAIHDICNKLGSLSMA